MKEATGEFSMTVVTIIAILVIAGVIMVLKGPLTEYIQNTWQNQATNTITDVNNKNQNDYNDSKK